MTSRPKPFLPTLALVALVLTGLCFGNLLHQIASHEDGHGKDSPLTCWVCAATHHAPGHLQSESGVVAAPSPTSTDAPPNETIPSPAAERGSSPPRSPPYGA